MPARAQLSHVSRASRHWASTSGRVEPYPLHRQPATCTSTLDDVFLHRTEVLPPLDDVGVTPAAAFMQYCATARD